MTRVRHLSREKFSSIEKCPNCTINFKVNSTCGGASSSLSKFKVPKLQVPSRAPKILNCGHILCQNCLETSKFDSPSSSSLISNLDNPFQTTKLKPKCNVPLVRLWSKPRIWTLKMSQQVCM